MAVEIQCIWVSFLIFTFWNWYTDNDSLTPAGVDFTNTFCTQKTLVKLTPEETFFLDEY